MDLGIAGRHAIVCASSRGLGFACADALAREGVHVTINGRDPDSLARAAAQLTDRHDVAVTSVVGDIALADTRDLLLAACPEPDIVVNNNGGPPPGRFADWDRDAWIAALDANMLAPLAMIRAVLDAEIDIESPSSAECRRVYDTQRSQFTSPPLLEAAHILVEAKGEDAEALEQARQTAQGILVRCLAEPSQFAHLARTLSDCPSGKVGGSLGQLGPGDVVGEIERALGGLQAGDIFPRPVASRFGWHILKLERRLEGRELPFDYVEDKIALHLESRAWTASATRYVSDLADRARAQGVAFSISRDGRFATGSLSLGELLSQGGAADELGAWLDATDPELADRVRAAALADNLDVPVFVRRAVAHFVDNAGDESWTHLISAAQGAKDPAIAAMASLLRTKLTPKARTYTIVRRV